MIIPTKLWARLWALCAAPGALLLISQISYSGWCVSWAAEYNSDNSNPSSSSSTYSSNASSGASSGASSVPSAANMPAAGVMSSDETIPTEKTQEKLPILLRPSVQVPEKVQSREPRQP